MPQGGLNKSVRFYLTTTEWIGWIKYDKFDKSKLNNTAIATSIIPVQPFGFNFLGGKLIACLSTLESIRNEWEKRYKDKLVGLTTTSLYGSFSMYNSIPLWKKLGESKGGILLLPDDDIWKFWLNWFKTNHNEKYVTTLSDTGPKQNSLRLILKYLGINGKQYEHGHLKGVYFSPFYKNTKEYLRNEIDKNELILDTKIEKGLDYILDWWKPKAINRYKTLFKKKKLETEPLWYEDINVDDFNSWLNSRGVMINR